MGAKQQQKRRCTAGNNDRGSVDLVPWLLRASCLERLFDGPNNPQFIEVTKDKKVVWTFKDWKNFGDSMPVQAVLEAKQ